MIVWRWHSQSSNWQAILLKNGEALQMNEHALLLAQRGNRCLLISDASVEVNGEPVLPIRYLCHRDEIKLGDEVAHFSVESPIEVVAFALQEKEIACGRCKSRLKQGDLVVQCPQCSAWLHQSEALACWEHDERCSSCEQATSGIHWQPEAPTPSILARMSL